MINLSTDAGIKDWLLQQASDMLYDISDDRAKAPAVAPFLSAAWIAGQQIAHTSVLSGLGVDVLMARDPERLQLHDQAITLMEALHAQGEQSYQRILGAIRVATLIGSEAAIQRHAGA